MATDAPPGHPTALPANLIERGALAMLRSHLRDAPVVQLRGSRMVGKTTLAAQVCNSAWNLLAPDQRDIFNRDQRGILLSAPKPVLIARTAVARAVRRSDVRERVPRRRRARPN